MTLRLVNWNVEWASPRSQRSPEILRRIDAHAPHIVCLTEAHVELLPHGHAVCSQPDSGYPLREGRRKVVLWSREPWSEVDDLGDESLPPGRFVSGVTSTPLGDVTVMGICIPWMFSRVRGTPVKRRLWQDHEEYLRGLAGILERAPGRPLIVVGDFNQRIVSPSSQEWGRPGRGAPVKMREALQRAFPPNLTLATAALGFRGNRAIDHIALSSGLAAESLSVISNTHDQRALSDHFGIAAELSARPFL